MADKGFGSIYLGIFLSVGILSQVSIGAVVQEVHVVPSQGQTPGGQQFAPPSGHYPQAQHAYPGAYPSEAHPPYATPGLNEQYHGAVAQGSYPAMTYPQQGTEPQAAGFTPNTAGQLTPGQSQGEVAYTDPFAAPAQNAYPQGGQTYPGPDPSASAQPAYPGSPSASYPQGQQPAPQYQYPSQQYPGAAAQYQYSPQGSPFQASSAFMNPAGYPGQQSYPDHGYPQTPATAPAAAAASGQSQNQSAHSEQAWSGASFNGAPAPAPAQAQPAPADVQGQSAAAASSTFTGPAGAADAGVADTPAQGADAPPPAKIPLAATQKAEYPGSNAVPNQAGSFLSQGTNPAQYKYPDRKPLTGAPGFPTAVADAQAKTAAGAPSFPPAAPQTSPAGQYPPPPYSLPQPGKAPNSVAHGYPYRGYPYPGPYGHVPPYGMHPYHPGMGPAPYPGYHGRPYHGGHHRPPHAGQAPPHGVRGVPNPSNHMGQPIRPLPVTTTPVPETTLGATLFPPELRCYMQSECELGCCYAEDGSILWDHQNHYGKHGYCYQKTTTIPGEGCHPALCPCETGQKCTSVPSENATIPTGAGEAAEGAYFGNPKCYNHDQQLQIRDWLKKLERIVRACRLDYLCPLRPAH